MLYTNCLLKHVTEGKIVRLEVTGRRDDFTISRRYWKLKEAELALCGELSLEKAD
jgi:hypothetical protein